MMSSTGHSLVGRSSSGLAIALAPREGFDLHRHDHHQLALARHGVLTVTERDRSWVLPPTRGLWIPAGVAHSVGVSVHTMMMSVYVEPRHCPLQWIVPTVVDATDPAGALVDYLTQPHLDTAQRRRAEAVLWDVLAPLSVTTLSTRLPTDERARCVAQALLDDVTDDRSLDDWGHAVGASGRTLTRLFLADTGVSFSRWRTTARLAAALPMLASGTSVAATSRRVGYGTPSAFVAAFRRETGHTPADYFRMNRAAG